MTKKKTPVKKKPVVKKVAAKKKASVKRALKKAAPKPSAGPALTGSFMLVGDTLTVTINGSGKIRVKSLDRSEPDFAKVKELIAGGDWQLVHDELFATEKRIEEMVVSFSDASLVYTNGQLLIDGVPVPSDIMDKVLLHAKENLPFKPIVAFWRNLRANTSYRAVTGLFRFLETGHFPITDDGHFIAYKGVTEDFKDKQTMTMDNSPGQVVEIPRNQCNEDPNVACAAGLHAANFNYASSNYGGGKIIEVKVNPVDVVAVPYDHANHKLRCCKYVVLGEVQCERKEYYVPPSPPAASSNDDWNCDDDYENECSRCGDEHEYGECDSD